MEAKTIPVTYIESNSSLDTQDGYTYRIFPIDDCSCEPGQMCFIHAGKFTEKH